MSDKTVAVGRYNDNSHILSCRIGRKFREEGHRHRTGVSVPQLAINSTEAPGPVFTLGRMNGSSDPRVIKKHRSVGIEFRCQGIGNVVDLLRCQCECRWVGGASLH